MYKDDLNLGLQESYSNQTLSEVVKNNFRAAAVFEKYGLDFCCRGNKLISNACSEKGIDYNSVLAELKDVDINSLDHAYRPADWELDFLVDYVVNNHHSYVRKMIPVIAVHAAKVADVHGGNHPETVKVNKIFEIIYKDLKQHMMKEEQILFPYIKHMVNVRRKISRPEQPYFGSVNNPIKMMETEHQAAGDGLEEIRNLTDNYMAPGDACNTFKTLYKELKEFEEDLHTHVHLENNILFPKSMELEKELYID